MRANLALAVSAVAVVSLAGGQSPPATDFSRWTIVDPNGRTMTYLGRPSLFLSSGIALMPNAELADGTIEFDVAIHGHAGFAGVVFRGQSPDDFELIYLRTHRSRQWDALQYTPMFASQEAWQLYAGPGYNAPAELPLNRWVQVRIDVEGYTARVFVDGSVVPQLTVTDLKRPWAPGRVGLWGRFGSANFSNVKITPSASSAPSVAPASAPEPGVITRWALSPASEASTLPADRVPDVETWDLAAGANELIFAVRETFGGWGLAAKLLDLK
jgi:hypothetical protein